ncbi:DUF6907 domain-containing protein [Streptomyces wuyuanensis]|uniref:DUF6907 domain-containing protein n=1 Tax=Streptomyces wuyuanensis TaxID=1196353 RepID=UPI0037A5FE2C
MTVPRIVTVPTIDHGPVQLVCPPWCTGHDQTPQYRVDLAHVGPEQPFRVETSRGSVETMLAVLEQRPFTETAPGRSVFVNLQIDAEAYPCSPEQLDQAAAALVVHATHLRSLARQLSMLRARALHHSTEEGETR